MARGNNPTKNKGAVTKNQNPPPYGNIKLYSYTYPPAIFDQSQENLKDAGLKPSKSSDAPRLVNLIVLHCSDSDNPKHDNIETIRKWHTERGFKGPDGIEDTQDDIGYHFVITKDGKLHEGRSMESIGAHVKGHNENSIGICLTGQSKSQFTDKQFRTARKLIDSLFRHYGLNWKNVRLHNQLDPNKTCPNFKLSEVVSG